MHTFHIRYRNTQGTLMRIMNAASRRGIDIPTMHAGPADHNHQVTLQLEVNSRQIGQLSRDWYAIVDVIDVHIAIAVESSSDLSLSTRLSHPPAAVLTTTASSQATA